MALTYNGGTYAVMMGTPHDLADFAVGFSLSEGIVQSPDEIESFDIVEARRRHRTADVADAVAAPNSSTSGGGISQARPDAASAASSSIAEAIRPAAIVPKGRTFAPSDIMEAMAAIAPLQAINHETRAVHAAAFWTPARGIVSRCARTSAATTHWTSSPARWRSPKFPPPTASCC